MKEHTFSISTAALSAWTAVLGLFTWVTKGWIQNVNLAIQKIPVIENDVKWIVNHLKGDEE